MWFLAGAGLEFDPDENSFVNVRRADALSDRFAAFQAGHTMDGIIPAPENSALILTALGGLGLIVPLNCIHLVGDML